jgi:hypothetical protein
MKKNGGKVKNNCNYEKMGVRKEVQHTVMTITGKEENQVMLMSADVEISGMRAPIGKGLAFFDAGATVNFISEEKVKELGLKRLDRKDMDLYPFAHTEPIKMSSARYLVKILLQDGGEEELVAYSLKRALMPNITCMDKHIGVKGTMDAHPDLLIGMTHFWRFFRDLVPISPFLFKVETSVGPIICGELGKGQENQLTGRPGVFAAIKGEEPPGDDLMKNFWNLEAIGVRENPES